jgi:pimeloyl-ACP methyl ester carboxylesterase
VPADLRTDALPGTGELTEIEGAGHYMMVDDPAVFEEAVLDVIDRL